MSGTRTELGTELGTEFNSVPNSPRLVAFTPTFEAWREAARALLVEGVPPEAVLWREAQHGQLALDGLLAGMRGGAGTVSPAPPRVPRRFVELAALAACHADPARWALLYRVLWRLTHGEPHLAQVTVDPDVLRLVRLEKAVRRDIHKVHAFVRFRRVARDGDEHWVAWMAPAHDVLALSAPFFARRFPNMRWSILTPTRSAHWDGERLTMGPGVPREGAPDADELEAAWRTYYASIFNPARVRTRAMQAEMPKAYWHALPEAAIIAELLADAPRRVKAMLEREARDATRRSRRGTPGA